MAASAGNREVSPALTAGLILAAIVVIAGGYFLFFRMSDRQATANAPARPPQLPAHLAPPGTGGNNKTVPAPGR